jgi:hypothetical protein
MEAFNADGKKMHAIFRHLNKAQYSALIEFVAFKKGKEEKKIFEYLQDFQPKKNLPEPNLQHFYTSVFDGKKKIDANRLGKAFKSCLKLLEDFLTYQQVQKNEQLKHQLLSEYYAGTPLDQHFDQALNKWKKTCMESPDGPFRQHQLVSIYQTLWSHPRQNHHKRDASTLGDLLHAQANAQNTIQLLWELETFNRGQFLDLGLEISELDMPCAQMLQALKELCLPDVPNMDRFKEVFQLLIELKPRLEYFIVDATWRSLSNYCIRQIYAGNEIFIKPMQDLFEWALLDKNLKGRLDEDFLNYSSALLRTYDARNRDLMIENLSTVKNALKPDTYELVLAYAQFLAKDFTGTLQHLNKIKSRELIYGLRIHPLKLMTLVELFLLNQDEHQTALHLEIDAYENYFERKDLLVYDRRTQCLLLLKPLRHALRMWRAASEEERNKQYELACSYFEPTTDFAAKAWLKTKLNKP